MTGPNRLGDRQQPLTREEASRHVEPRVSLADIGLTQTRFYREVFPEGFAQGFLEGLEGLDEHPSDRIKRGQGSFRHRVACNLVRQTDLNDAAIAAATDLEAYEVRILRQSFDAA